MVIVDCPGCQKMTPNLRNCVHCQTQVNPNQVPQNRDIVEEWIVDQSENVVHNTVSTEALSDHGKYDRPLAEYLHSDEQIQAIYEVHRLFISSSLQEYWEVDTGLSTSGHLLVTDQHLICVVPNEDRDQVATLHYEDVLNIEPERVLSGSDRIAVELTDGCLYKYYLETSSGQEIDSIARIIEEQYKGYTPEGSPEEIEEEIDDVISNAEDASEALLEISTLIQEHNGDTHIDRAIGEAKSLDDLSRALANHSENSASDGPETLPTTMDEIAVNSPSNDSIGGRLKGIARDADPDDVGRYALGSVIALGSLAISLPYTTLGGLSVILAGGASTGAYASSNPDSFVADIDPIELGLAVRTGGISRRANSLPGGYGTGAILTAVDQVGLENLSPEHAKWITNIDIDTVMRDAELAAQAADRAPNEYDRAKVQTFGGAVGIAHSYAENSDGGISLDELVDEDLYEDALDALDDDTVDENTSK